MRTILAICLLACGFHAAAQFEEDPGLVHAILLEGSEKARDVAKETIEDVRAAIGIGS